MTAEYTPTTDDVGRVWAENTNADAAFDRWLAAHDREQRAQGWEEGVMDANGKAWLNVPGRDTSFHRYRNPEVTTYVVCDRLLDPETNEHCEFDGDVTIEDGHWLCPGCRRRRPAPSTETTR